MNPLVSVLMPLYNCESYVYETICSVLSQTWKNWELIIVDDGSTDSSRIVVESFQDTRIRIFSQSNKGGSAARNLAFSKSKGDYIQYLDADDLIDQKKIEIQIKSAIDNPNMLITGIYYRFFNNIDNSKIANEIGYKNYPDPFKWVLENYKQTTMFPPAVWLIPRELILKAGEWNTSLSYNDDFEFFTRLASVSKGIIFNRNAITYYRRGNIQSVSHRKDNKAINSHYQALNLASNYILKTINNKKVRHEIAMQYSKFIFSVYPNYKVLRLKASEEIEKLCVIPKQNFFNKNKLTGKLSRIFGWKLIKYIRYYLR